MLFRIESYLEYNIFCSSMQQKLKSVYIRNFGKSVIIVLPVKRNTSKFHNILPISFYFSMITKFLSQEDINFSKIVKFWAFQNMQIH